MAGTFVEGEEYRVRKGDTLSGISLKHGVSVAELKRENGLKGDTIRTGQTLRLPVPATGSIQAVAKATAGLIMPLRPWSLVVVHHSAIERGNAAIYHRNHLRRGMVNGLAYHFVIGNGLDSRDGEIEIGVRWLQQLEGGHVGSARVNAVGIGICLVGNFEEGRPSSKQLSSLKALIGYLRQNAMVDGFEVKGHREIAGERTVCPGRNFPLAELRARWNGI